MRLCAIAIIYVNAYAGCGRPTLNCTGRYWRGLVRSASKLISTCTQINLEMNCITTHRCTEIYCNVLQCTPMYSKRPQYTGGEWWLQQSGVDGKSACAVLLAVLEKGAVPELATTLSHNSMERTAMPSEEPARHKRATRASNAVCSLKVAFNAV